MSKYVYYYIINGQANCCWARGCFNLDVWNNFIPTPSECLWRIPNGIGDWSTED